MSGSTLAGEPAQVSAVEFGSPLDQRSQRLLKDDTKARKTIDAPYLHKRQRQHFVRYDVAPAIFTVAGACLAWAIPAARPGWFELGLFVAMWWITGLSITVGYHRLFTHRSFKTVRWVEALFAICGSMAGQGSYVSWAALHRRHHECSDEHGDPHSPNLHGDSGWKRSRGLLHAHLTWMMKHEYPSVVHYTPDLLGNPVMMRIERNYQVWTALGLAIPAALAAAYHGSWWGALLGLIWGGFARIFFLEHTIWAINSFLHVYGRRDFRTGDQSRNNHLFAYLTFGEAWHNNHHAFPGSAWFSLSWWRFDPAYLLIRALEVVGLAWDVKIPTEEQKQARRTVQTGAEQGV
jgi:stearoyl-CoA desaturase (delta-9 desaturase)